MKSCKKCFYYNNEFKRCTKFKCDISDSIVFGSACKEYSEIKQNKVKCITCINMNKYGYCLIKKKCFTFEEKVKERKCRAFHKKNYKFKKKK